MAVWELGAVGSFSQSPVMVVHNGSSFYAKKDVVHAQGITVVVAAERSADTVMKDFSSSEVPKNVASVKRKNNNPKKTYKETHRETVDDVVDSERKEQKSDFLLSSVPHPCSPLGFLSGSPNNSVALLPPSNSLSSFKNKKTVKRDVFIVSRSHAVFSWVSQDKYISNIAARLYNQPFCAGISVRPPPTQNNC